MGDSITFINGPFGWQIPCFPVHNGFVYLLHFDQPYKHAKHYLGSTGNLEARLQLHRSGNGARLMEVVSKAGIGFEVARLWRTETCEEARALEHKLKQWHSGVKLCPICQHKPLDPYVLLRQGHWALHLFQRSVPRRPMGKPHVPQFVR